MLYILKHNKFQLLKLINKLDLTNKIKIVWLKFCLDHKYWTFED